MATLVQTLGTAPTKVQTQGFGATGSQQGFGASSNSSAIAVNGLTATLSNWDNTPILIEVLVAVCGYNYTVNNNGVQWTWSITKNGVAYDGGYLQWFHDQTPQKTNTGDIGYTPSVLLKYDPAPGTGNITIAVTCAGTTPNTGGSGAIQITGGASTGNGGNGAVGMTVKAWR